MISTKSYTAAFVATLGILAFAAPGAGLAQTTDVEFGQNVASVTFGPYVRFELGGAKHDLYDAFWLPPGQSDPQIDFDPVPDEDWRGLAGLAVGYDWQNGFRADVSLFKTGTIGLTAPCSSATDLTPCSEHADITEASIESSGLMGNFYYARFEAQGSTAVFQPFLVGGLGFARNEMGPWTRTKNEDNTTGGPAVRTFEGATSSDLAWSVGLGASLQLTRPGEWPVMLEMAYRYFDYGTVSGGEDPTGDTRSSARQGFTVDHTDQVISLAIRVPLQRY
ncbi:MAG: outer membrane protein [Yoonia sp.]|uniref:outer membrane protein n=1 Tax=Yoonia sp. TaxID=2212373 RepID=UPI003EF5ADA2